MINYLSAGGPQRDPSEELDPFERQVLREAGAMTLDELQSELYRMREDDDYNYRQVMADEYFENIRLAKTDSDVRLREENRNRYSILARYFRGKALAETFAVLPVGLQDEVIKSETDSWLIRFLKWLGL